MKKPHILSAALAILLNGAVLFGQTTLISTKDNSGIDEMQFVTVGDVGNGPDESTGYGEIDYDYGIGKYDVTAEEYCAFLNAVATTNDIHGLYNTNMEADQKIACIKRSVSNGINTYTVIQDGLNRGQFPITYVSWFSAARFCNWMENGCPTRNAASEATTEQGTYTFQPSPDDPTGYKITENESATYFLPTEDEWYKAAYYVDGGSTRPLYWDYPTKSDWAPNNRVDQSRDIFSYLFGAEGANYKYNGHFTKQSPPYLTPVGAFSNSPGPYGTYDMGGNVFQWTTTRRSPEGSSSFFIARGGCWSSYYHYLSNDLYKGCSREGFDPSIGINTIGFRLVKRTLAPL